MEKPDPLYRSRNGVFDYVKSDVKNTSDIANELCLDYELTYRLLRALGSLGILKEEVNSEDGSSRFSLIPRAGCVHNEGSYTISQRNTAVL